MNFDRVKKRAPFDTYKVVQREDEDVVQNGLAMTPAQAMELVERGIPISNSNLQVMEIYKTGDKDFTVPMEFQRGVDMADMYQHRKEVTSKVKHGYDTAIADFSAQKTE